jgi:serine/threonine-protein kinase HipA
MALELNGKDDRLTRQDFVGLARTIGLTTGDAEGAIVDLTGRVADRAKTLSLPAFALESEAARTTQDKVIAIIVERCVALSGAST